MKRIVPDKPGHWWRTGRAYQYVEELRADENGNLYSPIAGLWIADDGTWLAEVPPPAVCAALADYAAKLAAWDARPQEGDAAHAFGDAGLVDGLAAALRAERGKS